MHNLRCSTLLFFFLIPFYSPASASELTLRFRSGHSVSGIKPKYYKNDIFILLRGDKTEELISVDSLIYVRNVGSPHTVFGAIIGTVGGAVIGGLMAALLDGGGGGGHGNVGPSIVIASGVVLGGAAGGVAGGIIGGNIRSDET
ncbi:MAG: hypothetical protein ABI623_04180, partial [bacterium]